MLDSCVWILQRMKKANVLPRPLAGEGWGEGRGISSQTRFGRRELWVSGSSLDLNLAFAVHEANGEAITPPGLPLPESERAAFVTDDGIRV